MTTTSICEESWVGVQYFDRINIQTFFKARMIHPEEVIFQSADTVSTRTPRTRWLAMTTA